MNVEEMHRDVFLYGYISVVKNLELTAKTSLHAKLFIEYKYTAPRHRARVFPTVRAEPIHIAGLVSEPEPFFEYNLYLILTI
jgi:hypothetical protein